MKTRKLIAGFMGAAVAATMAASVIVTAADSVNVTVSNDKVKAGEDFTLTVSIDGIPSAGMNACDFGIEYDSDLVSVSSVTKGELIPQVPDSELAVSDPLTTNIEDGFISVIYGVGTVDPAYYLKDSGVFLTIKGTVDEKAEAGSKAEFSIVPINRTEKPSGTAVNKNTYFGLIDGDENITVYTPTITDGYVEVLGDEKPTETTEPETTEPSEEKPTETLGEATKYGDVDCNGTIEVNDVVVLNMYLLDTTSNIPGVTAQGLANADVEKDSVVNLVDSGKLINFLAESIDESALGKS